MKCINLLSETKSILNGKFESLEIDGWSNINEESILAGSLIYNFKPYF